MKDTMYFFTLGLTDINTAVLACPLHRTGTCNDIGAGWLGEACFRCLASGTEWDGS
jgi:hypothetical protein